MIPPDGYFCKGMLVWGRGITPHTIIAKGFTLEVPDYATASNEARNAFHHDVLLLLSLVGDDWALQVQWSVDSDYFDVLERFRKTTSDQAENEWTWFAREYRSSLYLDQARLGQLRRERLALFFTRKCVNVPRVGFRSRRQIEVYLEQEARALEDKVRSAGAILTNAKIEVMGDREHYRYVKQFLNPSLRNEETERRDPFRGFDPGASIMEQCFYSDGGVFRYDEGCALRYDGFYHTLFVVERWPQATYPGIIKQLTSSVSLDAAITMNIFPLSIRKEIQKEESAMQRLRGDIQYRGKTSLITSLEKKESKIRALMQGFTIPFRAVMYVRVWAQDMDTLRERALRVKTSIQNMGGAQYHQVSNVGQARRLFFDSFPGYTGGQARKWDLYAENHYLADLMPLSSTFTGDLAEAEALYVGENNNLVGLRTFVDDTPQHAFMFGMTGSGKSCNIIDLLSQTECFFEFTAIVEEGLSYAIYTKLMGGTPIIIHPDSELCINYMDTLGMPLSPTVLSNAVGLCMKMVGASKDEDKNMRRSSLLNEYLDQLYWDYYEEWCAAEPQRPERLARQAYLIESHRRDNMEDGASFTEAYVELRDNWQKSGGYGPSREELGEEELLRFQKSPSGSTLMRNLAFAEFRSDEFPTHQSLVELMQFGRSSNDSACEAEVKDIASRLAAWTRAHGKNGALFDGTTNLNLGTSRIVHFELGRIPESNRELKEAAGFLLSNFVRQRIVSMPRGLRKRIVFEEVARFLNVPGGETILAESYAQLRKFGAWVISITQQYSQLKDIPLRPVILGNSKLFLILSQKERSDLEDFGTDRGLPETAIERVLGYQLPEKQVGLKHAPMLLFGPDGLETHCGTIRNYTSEEMLTVAASNGREYDRKMRALLQYDSIFAGVLEETNRRLLERTAKPSLEPSFRRMS